MNRDDWRLAIAVAIIGMMAFGGFYYDNLRPKAADQETAQSNYGKPQNRTSLVTGKPADRDENQSEDAEKRKAATEWNLMFFTGLLVAVGAGQAGLFFWQLRIIRESGDDTKAVARAAQKSAEIAERALIEHQRPWIFRDIVTVHWRGTGIPANDWDVSLKWKNIGRAPALLSALVFSIDDADTLPADPDYTRCTPLNLVDALPEGQDFDSQPLGPASPLTKDDGKPVQYVFWGRLTYREMNGHEHHSGYALLMGQHFAIASSYNSDAYNYYT